MVQSQRTSQRYDVELKQEPEIKNALKPTTSQIVDQIKQIEKYISRMPG